MSENITDHVLVAIVTETGEPSPEGGAPIYPEGEINTASNLSDLGLYKEKVGADLRFRGINTETTSDIEIKFSVDGDTLLINYVGTGGGGSLQDAYDAGTTITTSGAPLQFITTGGSPVQVNVAGGAPFQVIGTTGIVQVLDGATGPWFQQAIRQSTVEALTANDQQRAINVEVTDYANDIYKTEFKDSNLSSAVTISETGVSELSTESNSLVGAINENRDLMFLSGFDRQTLTSLPDLAFVNGTREFTCSVKAGESEFYFWANGIKQIKTSDQSVIIPDVTGTYYFIFDNNGDLMSVEESLTTTANFYENAIVAVVYWNSETQVGWLSPEVHGRVMSPATHAYNHLTFGARFESGLNIEGLSNGSPTYTQHTSGFFWDEDIRHSVDAQSTAPFIYRLGASGAWRATSPSNAVSHSEGGSFHVWNEDVAGTWQLTEGGPTSDFWIIFHIATKRVDGVNFNKIIGQSAYGTVNNARNAIETELSRMKLDGLPGPETVFLYATIVDRTGDLRALSDGSVIYDLRETSGAGGGSVNTQVAGDIVVDASGFNKNLSATDVNVQVALATVDQLNVGDAVSVHGTSIVDDLPSGIDSNNLQLTAKFYQNLVKWSEDISQSPWAFSNATYLGTNGFVADSSTSSHGLTQSVTLLDGTNNNKICWEIDDGNANFYYFRVFTTAKGNNNCYFNVLTGEFTSIDPDLTPTAIRIGTKWFISIDIIPTSDSMVIYIRPTDSASSVNFTGGDGVTVNFSMNSCQVYQGITANNLPYIKTEATAELGKTEYIHEPNGVGGIEVIGIPSGSDIQGKVLEGQFLQNLFTYSEDVSEWASGGIESKVVGTDLSPDGQLYGELTESTSTGAHFIDNSPPYPLGKVTVSFWAKAGVIRDKLFFLKTDSASTSVQCGIDLLTGATVGTQTNIDETLILKSGDDVQINIEFTTVGTPSGAGSIYPSPDGSSGFYTGDNSDISLYITGLQVRAGTIEQNLPYVQTFDTPEPGRQVFEAIPGHNSNELLNIDTGNYEVPVVGQEYKSPHSYLDPNARCQKINITSGSLIADFPVQPSGMTASTILGHELTWYIGGGSVAQFGFAGTVSGYQSYVNCTTAGVLKYYVTGTASALPIRGFIHYW